jgi:hypothetical protein
MCNVDEPPGLKAAICDLADDEWAIGERLIPIGKLVTTSPRWMKASSFNHSGAKGSLSILGRTDLTEAFHAEGMGRTSCSESFSLRVVTGGDVVHRGPQAWDGRPAAWTERLFAMTLV